MGITSFRDLGDVANAGRIEGLGGRVQEFMEQLPPETFYWIDGKNPTTMVPYATWRDGMVVIDVQDDIHEQGGDRAIGLRLPSGAQKDDARSDDAKTIFSYGGVTYRVEHLSLSPYAIE